jgi:hypothetical protein
LAAVTNSISKSTKEVFSVEGAWFSPNMLPTVVHSKAFCIIARHHPIERASHILCGFDPVNKGNNTITELRTFTSIHISGEVANTSFVV